MKTKIQRYPRLYTNISNQKSHFKLYYYDNRYEDNGSRKVGFTVVSSEEFIDQPKEGTRNYSKKISNLRFWDFNKFELRKILNDLKKPNIFHKFDYKTIFKLVSLEIIYRDMKNIRYSILRNGITREGYRNLL